MVSVWGDLAAVTEVAGAQWGEAVVLPGEAHLVEETIGSHYESVDGAPATREQGVEAFAPKRNPQCSLPWRRPRSRPPRLHRVHRDV
jgi:hypothetical protein